MVYFNVCLKIKLQDGEEMIVSWDWVSDFWIWLGGQSVVWCIFERVEIRIGKLVNMLVF